MSDSYSRNTELRNVRSYDLYNLALILEEDNYWQELMEIIPKHINNQTFGNDVSHDFQRVPSESAAYERKYNNDHIRLIQSAILRPGETRLYSEILFDEWGSSGRKHERPTLGVLLYLLVQSKLYRAADFVAELLNEPKPARPTTGPAAEYTFDIDVFNDIQDVVNGIPPTTDELQANVGSDINKDFYTKCEFNKKMPPSLSENNPEQATTASAAPIPMPRTNKSARLKQQNEQLLLQHQQMYQLPQAISNSDNVTPNCIVQQEQQLQQNYNKPTSVAATTSSSPSTGVLPDLSILMNSNLSVANDTSLPLLSAFQQNSEECSAISIPPSLLDTKSNLLSENHKLNDTGNIDGDRVQHQQKHDNDEQHHDNIPALSALNLNGERDDDNDVVVPQQQSSNLENIPASIALNFNARNDHLENRSIDDLNIPNIEELHQDFNEHYLESIAEDSNDIEPDLDDDNGDGNSIPDLSFLDNCSSKNDSSLTSVTNTSGDNSFE